MRAEIVSVGTELLLGQTIDTNASFLARVLAEHGVDLLAKQTVGDNLTRVAAAVRLALDRADLVITTGGLGPTEDDLTVEAVASAVGVSMVFDQEVADSISRFFSRRRRQPPESVFRQARIPHGAQVVPNRHGTAPGLILLAGGDRTVFMLPGVPREMEGLVAEGLRPWLESRVGVEVIRSRVLRITGLGESAVEELVRDLIHGENPTIAPLAKLGEVNLRITAKGTPADVETMLGRAEQGLRERLGDAVFGTDGQTLEEAVATALIERGLTLALAESCTGGVTAARLTDIPGSSAYMLAGYVTYSNEAKVRDLGVPPDLIERHGAVSREVAVSMATGARMRAGADIGLAITGIAGPTGATEFKPVGLIYVAIATADGDRTRELRLGSEPGRRALRHLASQVALNALRLEIAQR